MTHQTPIFDPIVAKMHAFTSRLLILSIIAVAVSSAVNVYASPVDLYNGNTLVSGSFTDVGEAINSNLDGNKIVISGDNATHNVTATNSARSNLTVRGDSDSSQRTVSVGTGVLYDFSVPAQVTIENLKYEEGGQLIKVQGDSSSLKLTLNNTTISKFGAHVISSAGGVEIIDSKNVEIIDTNFEGVSNETGGLIYSGKNVLISNSENIKFNKIQGPRRGGWSFPGLAIYCKGDLTISNTKNMEISVTDGMYGNAVVCEGNVYFDNSTLRVHHCVGYGVQAPIFSSNAYFSGDNSYVLFYENGTDDIKLSQQIDNVYVKSELSFKDNGVYTFGSGIYLQEIDANSYADNSTTTINKAHVTLEGRTWDDITTYRLRAASISNGGTLTVNLDQIDVLNGNFNLDNTAKMELNVVDASITKKLTMYNDNSASVTDRELVIQGSGKLSKSGAGTLQILAEANGLVGAESIVVSSGRLDYKGYFTGNVKVAAENNESDPIFSPGNSVGDANVTGNVIIDNGIILFEFGSYPGSDSNHDVLNITNGRFSAGEGMINLYFESGDVESWAAEEKFEYLLVSGAGLGNGEYTSMLNPEFTDYFKLLGKNGNLYLVDTSPIPEPVPEPATWALLILGAVGALYFRKRVRK